MSGVLGPDEPVSNFSGGIAADEPRAEAIGREILAAGGSAADAAAAVYFALAVTRPAAAGLGAGGVCLVFDREEKRVRALDFTPAAAPAASGEGVPVPPPGAVRGMAALQAAHGKLPWSQIVAPAEKLARFGGPVVFPTAEEAGMPAPLATPETMSAFVAGAGALRQPDLAAVLGRLRVEGAGDLYGGALGDRYVEAVRAAGGALDRETLRGYTPEFRTPVVADAGRHRIHFAPGFASAGPFQAAFWGLITWRDRLEDADPADRAAVVADAAARAAAIYAAAGRPGAVAEAEWPGDERLRAALAAPTAPAASLDWRDGGTGFVAVDRQGQAVACGVSLNRPYGLGRLAPGTGIFPAVYPRPDVAPGSLGPVLIANPNTQAFYFATGAGGPGGAVLAPLVAHRTRLDEQSLLQALAGPRPAPGRVNAASCDDGLPSNPDTCTVRSDGRAAFLPGS